MISIRLRRLYRRLSCLMGWPRDFLPRMQGLIPFIFKGFAKPIGIVAPVGQKPVGLGQAAQQRCGAGIVADLARSHEELEWAAPGIRDGVQLGIHATYGSPDQSATPPFFNRRLDAVRCAFR